MSSFIEDLNQWGGQFLNFAWPMLWQSSLLMVILFAADFLIRGKIRASIRYALWLVVLVKLCLPPTLAMPTSAAWWLFQNRPAVEAPTIKKYVVTYDSTLSQSDLVPQTAPIPAPEPKLDGAGRALLAAGTVSMGLLLWLLFRWRQVMRKIDNATLNTELNRTLEAVQQLAGLRARVRLKMATAPMSPAVCGLFNPVILLPQTLVEKLSAGQLRAVLLHELFHLRRKDVWANCAQALLQIVYWWHPLLWLANARIRRVREEAVDDAVMLALRDEAESYAPTLLEVAKLAFIRPQLSLGLVGIMESRSALRQRIERLVNFRPPRKAGLTFLSLCGIFIFSAVALPMGQAPAESSNPTLSGLGGNLNQPNSDVFTTNHFPNSTNVLEDKMKANDLVGDAKLLYEMGKFDQAEERLTSALTLEPDNQAAHYCMDLVQEAKASHRKGMIQTLAARKNILDKINRIRIDQFGPYNRRPLSEVVRELNQLTAGLASDKTRIHFFTAVNADKLPRMIGPNTGRPTKDTSSNGTDINSVIITVNPALTNVTVAQVLDAITWSADKPIQYSISEKGIVFSPKDNFEAPRLYSRTFRVHPVVFLANLQKQVDSETNVATALRRLFLSAGLDLTPPETIFYNDGLGFLFVRATEPDLDVAGKIIQTLSDMPPQVHIKARFIEVPEGTLDEFGKMMNGSNQLEGFAGILTGDNAKVALKNLESRPGVEELAEPEVTTTSGRQTEMRATQIINVVTNFTYQEIQDRPMIVPQTNLVETGPVLDVIPIVLSDDYTIYLLANASVTQFLGYDQPTNSTVVHDSSGRKIDLPTILPSFAIRKASANIKLWDGQTLVLGGMKARFYDGGKEVGAEPDYFAKAKAARGQPDEMDKELLVFITVNLVDPAGNRIHSDDEIPFAKNSIPSQGNP